MHEHLTRTFGQAGVDGEIVFVGDGSPEADGEVLNRLADRDQKVTVVRTTAGQSDRRAHLPAA